MLYPSDGYCLADRVKLYLKQIMPSYGLKYTEFNEEEMIISKEQQDDGYSEEDYEADG